jgi:hypothetical protein
MISEWDAVRLVWWQNTCQNAMVKRCTIEVKGQYFLQAFKGY